MTRRVVVSGLGAITPLGHDVPRTWEALLAGRSGAGPITQFDASDHACKIAAEVSGFDPLDHLDKRQARRLDRFVQFALVASREAIADARLVVAGADAERIGVYVGSGIGGLYTLMETHDILRERGPRRISPFFIPAMILNMASGQISIEVGARGPNLSCATACATGCHAIGESFRLIREGYCDVMIAGGSEATIHPITIGGFSAMKALSTRNDAPEAASRPFDRDRDGFVMGEGAGVLVLEERERARARGARIYAELAGYGLTADAFHVSAPAEDGDGAVRAMAMALRQASLEPERVQYVNAHGTSTPVGDRIEAQALVRVFGDAASSVAFASTKSMTGHLLGAAGGLESVATVKAIAENRIPPTINHDRADDDFDLDCVPNVAIERDVTAALNNSFGFGGTNACLLMIDPAETT